MTLIIDADYVLIMRWHCPKKRLLRFQLLCTDC
ncbi:hypothetical protein F441_23017 [Phytophthora nicotianae CJ01A1]|uniref:Uncharacterized protein n=4 Tax=Phytophthora nicotianae TaxID=4792 RepID=V9DW18_PHYNI|nr:hypothetical protein F443_22669 [Phytophthora nicotianae P1569]ETK70788.1 hypothetical protein L915_21886 [Phytophthora nicotianae]ETO99567.1 hypothetical protein F441_23017 [Phytophthora nicotianae CJ01A1]ETP28464.1 hypothetical protein F442_22242 [Phytophthora nicotianae P10297]ETL24377.1 hypothetical protein L916_21609 [Phytophthora nicotianae]